MKNIDKVKDLNSAYKMNNSEDLRTQQSTEK
jgi:hypothetical protein